ncbi:MAG: ChbG/HpnK family deacetylase [Elusimicrobia bacterium]|nr:ChbG/HpnK family deacetylase [Elusimicrobiota bacterium]
MSRRILITTADDFGASAEVNEAVVQACREGVLRFASLMAEAPAAEAAAEAARALPGLGVGVHLVLCETSPAAWGLRLAADAQARRELEGRLTAQVERALSFGIKPTHLDSHFNAHVHPAAFPIVLRLARRFAVPRVRWPEGELGPSLAYSRAGGLRQALLAGTYGALGLASRWRAGGVSLTRAFGMLRSGMMTEDYALWLLRRLPEGTTEMYFHPSLEPAPEAGLPTPSHRSAAELRTLLSPRVRQTLREEGIELLAAAR